MKYRTVLLDCPIFYTFSHAQNLDFIEVLGFPYFTQQQTSVFKVSVNRDNKYFKELSRILRKQDIECGPVEDGRLVILLDGQPVGRIESGPIRCLAPGEKVNCPEGAREATLGCLRTPEASEAFHKAVPFAEMVAEYMGGLKRAPLLQADGLSDKFYLLADFNGTDLADKELEGGYGMQFVTWDWSYDRSSVEQGHYYHDDYEGAKADFAERLGLVQKGRYFSDEQIIEMYRCMQDTLDSEYVLTEKQDKLISDTCEQIEGIIPDLHERITQAKREMESYQQTM